MKLAPVEVVKSTSNVMARNSKVLVFIALMLLGGLAQAQINLSADMDDLMSRYRSFVKENKITEIYSVNVLSTPDRRKMETVKNEFRKTFSSYDLDWIYEEPYYKLFTGKYLTEQECWSDFYTIRKEYPNAIIHIDRIEPQEYYEDRD